MTGLDHLLSSYHYHLPSSLIAQHPSDRRDGSRMMLLPRHCGEPEHRCFSDLPGLLRGDELLVLNDTRVIPARIQARKDSGGAAEILGLGPWQGRETVALVRTSKAVRPGGRLVLPDGSRAEVLEVLGEGRYHLRLDRQGDWLAVFEALGEMPLPPYIRRDRPEAEDRDRYQTIYAEEPGAVAAPTAGLHFTKEILAALAARGVELARLTLHVGLGTFLPVRADDLRDHRMHAETLRIPPDVALKVDRARASGRPVIAVGTTVVRALETAAGPDGRLRPGQGETDIFIRPGHVFRAVDGLLTNFHLPGSTLLMLVSALCGRERILAACTEAVRQGYRFFSYGDCMLIR
ncbi:MAG: tRNA preQ1(34) S-adenosylmethionine ribosyltransferase-isomerase QueA [Deltaproteobacteria bacterium]|nr:tRNA preQ1(34) S-adenosylmethionine ribosyltransferase-isomerase QueA [Deltaproteobacteria bacterium]